MKQLHLAAKSCPAAARGVGHLADFLVVALSLAQVTGCTKNSQSPSSAASSSPAADVAISKATPPAAPAKPEEKAGTKDDLVGRGHVVYMTYCTACHNVDPKRPGALGPELYGASMDLLEARVMRTEYPAGYTPKRTSKVMVALPQLKTDIPALHAFLNSP